MTKPARPDGAFRALVLEDDVRACKALAHLVGQEGFAVLVASNLQEARKLLGEERVDCALLDLELPDGSGMDLVQELQGESSETEILVLTGHGSIDTAVEALRLGVVDFLTKPLDVNRLRKVLHDVRRTLELRKDVETLRDELRDRGRFVTMVGKSPPMQEVYDLIRKVAPTSSTVLILGETGTGKDLAAQAIHKLSKRKEGPFVPVNCAAMQPTLIESELFGHEAGAFTGAAKRRKGFFEQAHGGTLFLDEVFEMPIGLQVKLLRALENRTITRVGGESQVEVDVRLIAASNKNPDEVVKDEEVREDLLYRLMVFPLRLPPLRQRGDDIVLLARHFLSLLSELNGEEKRFTAEAFAALASQQWPGNVRQLRNAVERAYILGGSEIDESSLRVQESSPTPLAGGGDSIPIQVGMSTAEAERVLIEATLESFDGDKARASEVLGISLKTLYNRLREYGAEGRVGRGRSKPTSLGA